MILLLFTLTFCFFYILYMGQAISGWATFTKKHYKSETTTPYITVLVPFRNEENNIGHIARSLLAQPMKGKDQIIFIDDHSQDDGYTLLKKEIANNKQCILLTQSPNAHGKKSALELGIEYAQNQWVITVDADCTVSKNWLSQWKLELKHTSCRMLVGPVSLEDSASLLTKYQSLEFAGLMSLGAGNLAKGNAQTCSGANLAYQKSAFKEVNGFEGNKQYASGDDEFLMHKFFEKDPNSVGFAYNSNTLVKAKSAINIKSFFLQRLRWASKGSGYTIKRLRLEQVFVVIYILHFWFSFYLAMKGFSGAQTSCAFLFITKLIMDYVLLSKTAYFFKVNHILGYLPISQIIQYLYVPLVAIASFFTKGSWKGRKI